MVEAYWLGNGLLGDVGPRARYDDLANALQSADRDTRVAVARGQGRLAVGGPPQLPRARDPAAHRDDPRRPPRRTWSASSSDASSGLAGSWPAGAGGLDVELPPLELPTARLRFGAPRIERLAAAERRGLRRRLLPGDDVAVHWDRVCGRLEPAPGRDRLIAVTDGEPRGREPDDLTASSATGDLPVDARRDRGSAMAGRPAVSGDSRCKRRSPRPPGAAATGRFGPSAARSTLAIAVGHVGDERRIAGDRVGRGDALLEPGRVVDGDHQPPEERAEVLSAPTSHPWECPPRRRSGAGEVNTQHGDAVDATPAEVSTERQVLVRDRQPVDDADEAPREVGSQRHRRRHRSAARRPPRPAVVTQILDESRGRSGAASAWPGARPTARRDPGGRGGRGREEPEVRQADRRGRGIEGRHNGHRTGGSPSRSDPRTATRIRVARLDLDPARSGPAWPSFPRPASWRVASRAEGPNRPSGRAERAAARPHRPSHSDLRPYRAAGDRMLEAQEGHAPIACAKGRLVTR